MLKGLLDKILFFDGGMGTSIQKRGLTPDDFGGKDGFNDYLSIYNPQIIQDIHASFFSVGVDVVETNTFGGSRLKLDEYGIGEKTYELNRKAAEIAKEVARGFSTPDQPRFVAGSIGPTGMLPSSSDETLGKITPKKLENIFHEQILALIDGGADSLIIETSQDILEARAAVFAALRAFRDKSVRLPIILQVTLDPTERMLLGTDIGSVVTTMEHLPVDIIGINCSTGPAEMKRPIEYLSRHCRKMISCQPNAGIPENIEGETVYPLEPADMATALKEIVDRFNINIVGGCCGTTPEHLDAVIKKIGHREPGKRGIEPVPALSSSITSVPLGLEPKPLMVGERVNSQGSRKTKELLLKDDYDGLIEIARDQVEGGAHLLDICVALNERDDEKEQMLTICKRVSQRFEAPIVVDSTEADVIESALEVIPGRALINSINLEGDGERFYKIMPIAAKYGAAVIAMTIGKNGMAQTAEEKFRVAREMHDLAKSKYNYPAESLIFDTLTFTLATGEEKYRNSAVETLEGIKRIKAGLPGTGTVLGVSNVSFGLSGEGRKILNSVFLYHAVRAGLDLAIINPTLLIAYPSIEEDARRVAEDLIFNRGENPLFGYLQYFERRDPSESREKDTSDMFGQLPLPEKIHYKILNRQKDGIENLLDQALKEQKPVEIINNILLPAMKDVGDKMATGELILPFVLQSAEVMKKSISHLEQFMDKNDSYSRGKVVLATVYGDVHDIGKNLVKTILSNNGYDVADLGKQVPLDTILKKATEINADAIGLSALLVSTSKQMRYCVEELHKRGWKTPMIVGGAAINRRYCQRISMIDDETPYAGGLFYCKDAFKGLQTLNRLMDPKERDRVITESIAEAKKSLNPPKRPKDDIPDDLPARSAIQPVQAPNPPFIGTKILTDIPLDELFPLLDLNSLFRLGWGILERDKRAYQKLLDEKFHPLLVELEQEVVEKNIFDAKISYGYFHCRSSGDDLLILDPEDNSRVITSFTFTRQPAQERLCLSDYFSPELDIVAFHLATIGHKTSDACDTLNANGEYARALYLHGLSVETTEAMAEWIHRRVRKELGLDPKKGLRYSAGYPTWPNLEDQKQLFTLLKPDRIGVSLTSAFQMVPEQSTSAIILHHPEARYFNIPRT